MDKISSKINLSSVQVIKTLQVLLQGTFTMQELIEKLNENEPVPVFNNSVISKYINTCRYCGIEIHKINNKYHVVSLPFGLELTEEEVDLLNEIRCAAQKTMTKKSCKTLDKLIQKINQFSNKKISKIGKDDFQNSFELFEQAVTMKRKIKLIFKSKVELDCIPVRILEKGEKTFFEVYNKKIRYIDISRLSGVQALNEKFVPVMSNEPSVTYTIKGDLASRYSLRENEHLLHINPDGSKTIVNKGEIPDMLLSRLLRYDDLCEVNFPKTFRDRMKEEINKTLENYGE